MASEESVSGDKMKDGSAGSRVTDSIVAENGTETISIKVLGKSNTLPSVPGMEEPKVEEFDPAETCGTSKASKNVTWQPENTHIAYEPPDTGVGEPLLVRRRPADDRAEDQSDEVDGEVGERAGWLVVALLCISIYYLTLVLNIYYAHVLLKYSKREEYQQLHNALLYGGIYIIAVHAVQFLPHFGLLLWYNCRLLSSKRERLQVFVATFIPEVFIIKAVWSGRRLAGVKVGPAEMVHLQVWIRMGQAVFVSFVLVATQFGVMLADWTSKDTPFETWVPVLSVGATLINVGIVGVLFATYWVYKDQGGDRPSAGIIVALYLMTVAFVGGRGLTLGLCLASLPSGVGVLVWFLLTTAFIFETFLCFKVFRTLVTGVYAVVNVVLVILHYTDLTLWVLGGVAVLAHLLSLALWLPYRHLYTSW